MMDFLTSSLKKLAIWLAKMVINLIVKLNCCMTVLIGLSSLTQIVLSLPCNLCCSFHDDRGWDVAQLVRASDDHATDTGSIP